MHVTVRPYGLLADAIGATTHTLPIPEDATVADALDELAADTALDPTDVRVVILNGRHADRDASLSDGDTLALAERGAPE